MIWGVILLAGAAALSVLAWHMRRPNWRQVRISAVRFLPELQPSRAKRSRWSLRLPVGSVPFWLRMAICTLLLAALWVNRAWWTPDAPGDKTLALHVIVDVSASMGVEAGPEVTRLDLAKAQVRRVRDLAAKRAEGGNFCARLTSVAATPRDLGPVSDSAVAQLAVLPQAARSSTLAAMASAPGTDCAYTHAVVISDAPPISISEAEDAPEVIWQMVGHPVSNVAIRSARVLQPSLIQRNRGLHLELERFGEDGPDRIVLSGTGPGGKQVEPVEIDLTSLPPISAKLDLLTPGLYDLQIAPGGALQVDDKIRVRFDQSPEINVDWRLAVPTAPVGLALAPNAPDAVVVAPLADLSDADLNRPVLALAGGWRGPGEIGVFNGSSPLLDAINFDVLAERAPEPIPRPLPEGFVPVITGDQTGLPWIAWRARPRGVVIPDPARASDGETERLALTLFFNSLEWVLQSSPPPRDPVWIAPDTTEIANAIWESDTARPVGDNPNYATIAPRRAPVPPQPLWHWFLVAMLLFLLAERIFGVHWRTRTLR